MLQPFSEFIKDCKTGVKIHRAMNKVTDFAPIELSCRWKRQYEAREQRLTFSEYMTKKTAFLHKMMRYLAIEKR